MALGVAGTGRAGYCFHQNGALETALRALGYAVSRRHGHVWTTEEHRQGTELNHLVLVVSGLPTDANPGGDWWADASHTPDPSEDERLIAQAVEAARASDVALLVVGGNEDTNTEGWADNHLGDRDSLELVGRQNDLVKAVLETGKPTIVLLISGGPLSINYIAENVPAIIERIDNTFARKLALTADFYRRTHEPQAAALTYQQILRQYPNSTESAQANRYLMQVGPTTRPTTRPN